MRSKSTPIGSDHDMRRTAGSADLRADHLRVQLLSHARHEILAIALDLKGQEIVGEETKENVAPPGTHAQPIRIRPWNMPEMRAADAGRARAQFGGSEREVIVLNEDQGAARSQFIGDCFRESCVDRAVGIPILRSEDWLDVNGVAERPDAFVRESLVVAVHLLLSQPYSAQGVGGGIGRERVLGRWRRRPRDRLRRRRGRSRCRHAHA